MTRAGIVRYGVHLPSWTLRHADIPRDLGGGGSGARRVAAPDEDPITLAVAASRRLGAAARDRIERLVFATSNPVFAGKSNAAVVSAALDLPHGTLPIDLGPSVASGLQGLILAAAAGGRSLVTVADLQDGPAGSIDERLGGDGAAAFVLGDEDVVATIDGVGGHTVEVMERWRLASRPGVRTWEDRFAEHALVPAALSSLDAALDAAELTPSDVSRALVVGRSVRAVRAARGALPFASDVVVGDLTEEIGGCGAAEWALALAHALDRAEPGERIALTLLADGATTLLLRRTDQPHPPAGPRTASPGRAVDYVRHLVRRGRLERDAPRRPDPVPPSAPAALRTIRWKYGFVGGACAACGQRHLPPSEVCKRCGRVAAMLPVALADVPATVVTCTADHLAAAADSPLVAAVVDFDGGGRLRCEVADAASDEVVVGTRVRMTFRRIGTPDDTPNYFWKAEVLHPSADEPEER